MQFIPDKLETTFVEPITPYHPIKGRKYTLTHSDETGMMFLTIANEFDFEAINPDSRDELLGTWKLYDGSYKLFFYAYVGNSDYLTALKKYGAFKYHMNIALQAVVYGDQKLLKTHPDLNDSAIFVKYISSIQIFDHFEFYGYVKDYII